MWTPGYSATSKRGKKKYPDREVAEHFNINFEPHLGETFELVAVNGQKIETVTAAKIGSTEPPSIDWVDREGWDYGRARSSNRLCNGCFADRIRSNAQEPKRGSGFQSRFIVSSIRSSN